jgi:nitroimidazol reductase NimA-like FMN-containing flavoprotein (pyridoxamine 5'-phosphate oxidase superfamily)
VSDATTSGGTSGPRPEPLVLPPEYGASSSRLLAWAAVSSRLAEARHYWLATVRPDGRPHAVPLDGLWLDDRWYFGGSEQAVKHRNLQANPSATLHLEDAASAVVVEGTCRVTVPDRKTAARLTAESKRKYGYGPPPSTYRAGVWTLSPVRVLAWTDLTADATRFLFDAEGG